MVVATIVHEEFATLPDGRGDGQRRFTYSKVSDRCLKFVIVDIGPDGHIEWSEQESGELCWYTFKPSAMECMTIDQCIATGRELTGWARIDPVAFLSC